MTLYADMGAPHALGPYTIPKDSVQGLADTADVTLAQLRVRKKTGATDTWSASFTVTATTVVVTVPIDDGAFTGEEGEWRAYVLLTVPGGTLRSRTFAFTVYSAFTKP